MVLWIKIAGVIFEITGVSLLAVEAIKLDNVTRLRERYLRPLYGRLNPEIEFVDEVATGSFASRHLFEGLVIILVIAGAAILLVAMNIAGIDSTEVLNFNAPGPNWTDWALGIILFTISSLLTGLVVYTGIVYSVDFAVRVLHWIEDHTASGIVGILGLGLILASLAIRNYYELLDDS